MSALCWLRYDDQDYQHNRDFAALLAREGETRGLEVLPVLTSQLSLGMDREGRPYAFAANRNKPPQAVISRQRSSFLSGHFQAMGIPVFNNALVCDLCNDKRKTHQFLAGLPMLDSAFSWPGRPLPPPAPSAYPLVVKPAASHGGEKVFLVHHREEWDQALLAIGPEPMLYQRLASRPGLDMRVYVVFGEMVAAVLRRAQDGFLSNFTKGGHVAWHSLAPEERALARQVIERFRRAGAPLSFAGIDFLYHQGHPVVSEVEDVVGSRMLYQVSDINIAGLYMEGLRRVVSPSQTIV